MHSIYKISNALLGRDVDKPLPEGSDTTHAALATRFQRSFTEKVDALCCKRSQQPSDDMATEATARLHVFEPASPSDVKRIVMTSAAKSCELDPLPTSLRKTHIDFLCPVLARIINASLSSSVVPPPMKHAVVIPILKKRCSDVNILTNYRPISNIAFVAKLTERFVAQQPQHFMDVNGIRSLPKRIPPATQCRVSASTHSQRRGAVH